MASTARIDELQHKFDDNPRRYFAPLANEYRKAGQVDRAIALCREHLPKQPGHMSGHIVYGQALYEAGEQEEARRVFQAALDLDPENVIALRHMGDIERAGGQVDEAHRWYTRVLGADPRNAEVTALIESLGDVRGFTEASEAARAAALDAMGGVEWTPPPAAPAGDVAAPSTAMEDLISAPSHEALEINATLAELPPAGGDAPPASNEDAFYFPDLDSAPAGSALDPADAGEGRDRRDVPALALDEPFADTAFGEVTFGDAAPATSGYAGGSLVGDSPAEPASAAGLPAPSDGGVGADESERGASVDGTSLLEPAEAAPGLAGGWQEPAADADVVGATPIIDDRIDMSAVDGYEGSATDVAGAAPEPDGALAAMDTSQGDARALELPLIAPPDRVGAAAEDRGELTAAVADGSELLLPVPPDGEAGAAPPAGAHSVAEEAPGAAGAAASPTSTDDSAVMPIEAFGFDAAVADDAAEVPSIDAFAFDAPEEADAAGAELPSIAAFAYAADEVQTAAEELPSIDAFAFETVAAGAEAPNPARTVADEGVEPPSIEDYFFDGAGVVAETDALVAVERALDLPTPPPPVVPEARPELDADRAPAPGGGGSPFVTETMAELYLRQGFRDEALGVYRQLLASDPYNAAISAKVRELTGEHALVTGAAALAAPAAGGRDEPTPVETTSDAPRPAGMTARAFFAGLATRKAPARDRGVAADHVEAQRVTEQFPAVDAAPAGAPAGAGFEFEELDAFIDREVARPEAAGQADGGEPLSSIESYGYDLPAAPPADAGGGATLDSLFAHAPVRADDAAAASALSAAYGSAPAAESTPPGQGGGASARAARPATGGPSLDDIFRGAPAPADRQRRTTPTAFSFDQFFTDETVAGTPPPAPGATPPRRLGEESAGDLEQFNSWLEGLKRK